MREPWEREPSATDRMKPRPWSADNPALWDDSAPMTAARRRAAAAEVARLSVRERGTEVA